MNKCFITKLPSSVDNDNLPVLGQLRIDWLKQNVLTDNDQRYIELNTTDNVTVKVSGAHFTDSTLSSNLGNTKTIKHTDGTVGLYVSNDADAVLTIDNKYSLTNLSFVKNNKLFLKREVYFDIDGIEYCTNLDNLNLSSTKVRGDIGSLSKLTKLIDLRLINTQVSGDISALSNLTNISNLFLSGTKVSGSVNSLANLTKLTVLDSLSGISLTGDMSKIPANVRCIALSGDRINTNFTWTANGRKNATLLSMFYNIPFDTTSMDNMLIDQATCTVASSATSNQKVISVRGTRTAASDAAVTAIQNMGITITGVTKQA